jgi:hypothetical protein
MVDKEFLQLLSDITSAGGGGGRAGLMYRWQMEHQVDLVVVQLVSHLDILEEQETLHQQVHHKVIQVEILLHPFVAGGGGGAVQAGFNANTVTSGRGGAGGNGATSSINGTPTARAGGGGGGSNADLFPGPMQVHGGSGGGGAAGNSSGPPLVLLLPGTPGTINTGGGGGGGAGNTPIGGCNPSGAGGSGIVIIRYKFQ